MSAKVESQVMEVVRGHFRPEFLNRLDEIILFHRLSASHMAPIVDIQVARLQRLLDDRKIRLDLTDAARLWLGRVGYDPVYGARPLKRAVQKYLQDPLADAILAGKVHDGSTVRVDEGDGALVLTPHKKRAPRGALLSFFGSPSGSRLGRCPSVELSRALAAAAAAAAALRRPAQARSPAAAGAAAARCTPEPALEPGPWGRT